MSDKVHFSLDKNSQNVKKLNKTKYLGEIKSILMREKKLNICQVVKKKPENQTLIRSMPSSSAHSKATITFLMEIDASMYCSQRKRNLSSFNYEKKRRENTRKLILYRRIYFKSNNFVLELNKL